MIKEIEKTQNEFLNIFEELTYTYFHRYYGSALTPYFKLKNGKNILLETLHILRDDRLNDFNVLQVKPGKFITAAQERNGNLAKYSALHDFTIPEFRNGDLGYIADYKFIIGFTNEDKFKLLIDFIEKRYDFLKNIQNYNAKNMTLKELRKLFIK